VCPELQRNQSLGLRTGLSRGPREVGSMVAGCGGARRLDLDCAGRCDGRLRSPGCGRANWLVSSGAGLPDSPLSRRLVGDRRLGCQAGTTADRSGKVSSGHRACPSIVTYARWSTLAEQTWVSLRERRSLLAFGEDQAQQTGHFAGDFGLDRFGRFLSVGVRVSSTGRARQIFSLSSTKDRSNCR
jgi:hypothetical protein